MSTARNPDVEILYKVIENYQRRQRGLERRESEVRNRLKKLGELFSPSYELSPTPSEVEDRYSATSKPKKRHVMQSDSSFLYPHKSVILQPYVTYLPVDQDEQSEKSASLTRSRSPCKTGVSYKQCETGCDLDYNSSTQIFDSTNKRVRKLKNGTCRECSKSRKVVKKNVDKAQCSDVETRAADSYKQVPIGRKDNMKADRSQKALPVVDHPSSSSSHGFSQEDTARKRLDSKFKIGNGEDFNTSLTRQDSSDPIEKRHRRSRSSRALKDVPQSSVSRHHSYSSQRDRGTGSSNTIPTSKSSLNKGRFDWNRSNESDKWLTSKYASNGMSSNAETLTKLGKTRKEFYNLLSLHTVRTGNSSDEYLDCQDYKSKMYSDNRMIDQLQVEPKTDTIFKKQSEDLVQQWSANASSHKEVENEHAWPANSSSCKEVENEHTWPANSSSCKEVENEHTWPADSSSCKEVENEHAWPADSSSCKEVENDHAWPANSTSCKEVENEDSWSANSSSCKEVENEDPWSANLPRCEDVDEEYSDSFLSFLISKCLSKSQLSSLSTDIENSQNIVLQVEEIFKMKKLICEELEYREQIKKPYKLCREDKDLLIMNIIFANAVKDGITQGRSLANIVKAFNQSNLSYSIQERTLHAIHVANKILGEQHPDPVGLEALQQAASQCLCKLKTLQSGICPTTPDSLRMATTNGDFTPAESTRSTAECLEQNYQMLKQMLEQKANDAYEESVRASNEVNKLENEIKDMKRRFTQRNGMSSPNPVPHRALVSVSNKVTKGHSLASSGSHSIARSTSHLRSPTKVVPNSMTSRR